MPLTMKSLARNPSQSAFPSLWDGLVYCLEPRAMAQPSHAIDFSKRVQTQNATLSGLTWRNGEYTMASDVGYIDTGVTDGFSTGCGAVVMRFFPTANFNDSAAHFAFGTANVTNGVPVFAAVKWSDNNWYIGWYNYGEARVQTPYNACVQNAWNHWVLNWGATSELYLNGKYIGANTNSATAQVYTPSSGKTFLFGSCAANTGSAGLGAGSKISSCCIYNRKLTTQEIMLLARGASPLHRRVGVVNFGKPGAAFDPSTGFPWQAQANVIVPKPRAVAY